MTMTTIYSLIIAAVPSLVAVIGIVIACVKVVKKFAELKNAVVQQKEFEELKRQLIICHQENIELKRQVKEVIEAVSRVKQ